jgi:adenosine deaminase
LTRLRFRVTVNTDNRLMSGTTMSREMQLLGEAFGYDPFDERLALIDDVNKPGYAELVSTRSQAFRSRPRRVPAQTHR